MESDVVTVCWMGGGGVDRVACCLLVGWCVAVGTVRAATNTDPGMSVPG